MEFFFSFVCSGFQCDILGGTGNVLIDTGEEKQYVVRKWDDKKISFLRIVFTLV